MKNKNKIKRAEGGRQTVGQKLSRSSSAVDSVKKTTEELTEMSSKRKWKQKSQKLAEGKQKRTGVSPYTILPQFC